MDVLRRAKTEATKLQEVAAMPAQETSYDESVLDSSMVDDRLRLIFTCCPRHCRSSLAWR